MCPVAVRSYASIVSGVSCAGVSKGVRSMKAVPVSVSSSSMFIRISCQWCVLCWCRSMKANGLSISVAFGCIIVVGVNAFTEHLMCATKKRLYSCWHG